MNKMNNVPIEILVKIFSNLRSPHLLIAAKVCHHWQSVIECHFWHGLSSIREETILYPYGDYLNTFIQLAHQVPHVDYFLNPFELLSERLPFQPSLECRLRRATLDLAKKLSPPDALFPLDIVRSVVTSQLKTKQDESTRGIRSRMRAVIKDVVHECRVSCFEAVRINKLFVHSSHRDPFVIEWKNEEVLVPIDLSKITRLVIGCLVIRLQWDGWIGADAEKQAVIHLRRVSKFESLKTVEIGSVHMLVYPDWAGHEPSMDMKVHFGADHRQFSVDEFESLLAMLTDVDDYTRDLDVAQYVKKWREDGRIERAELRAGSELFWKMQLALTPGRDESSFQSDAFHLMVAQVLPLLIDTLHLAYEQERAHQHEECLLDQLKAQGVLSRLKVLSVSFCYKICDGDLILLWNTRAAVSQARLILRTIRGTLNSLEKLTLKFLAGGLECPSGMFESIAVVNGPLPRLRNLECIGLPCLPFIVSVVSQAPNLHRLAIGCQPFENDQLGLEWISKLIDSVSCCPRLMHLQICVCSEEELTRVPGRRRGQKRARKKQNNRLKINHLLDGIEAGLRRVVKEAPCLSHLSVLIDSCDYHFVVDKELNLNDAEC